jgi:hypothetical protein
MMPAEIMAGAVPVPPDALSQTQDLLDQLPVEEPLELIVGCHHGESLRRPSFPLFGMCGSVRRNYPMRVRRYRLVRLLMRSLSAS